MAEEKQWNEIQHWVAKSKIILLKKLSRNDCSWADDRGKHQYGPYIPADIRESGFLPSLHNKNKSKPHIFETEFITFWPSTAELKASNLKHYSNKGPETHFTGVPKDEFTLLTPASLLIGGVLAEPLGAAYHWFMTIDSASLEAELLESILDIGADFHHGLYSPELLQQSEPDESDILIQELNEALQKGTIETFINRLSKLPSPNEFAHQAQVAYLNEYKLLSLDPYGMENPGDAIMRISRDIEYKLYKRSELRYRASEVVRIIHQGGSDMIRSVVHGFPKLDAIFLSASQNRKSRAGLSFERHISKMLQDGNIRFEEQAVTGRRRPDFVMPNVQQLNVADRSFNDALILSAKTTLRERWKQVPMEKLNCAVFLATVDDRISSAAIADMEEQGIRLVVPESLKKSKETCYKEKENVITFRNFFDQEISEKRPVLIVK